MKTFIIEVTLDDSCTAEEVTEILRHQFGSELQEITINNREHVILIHGMILNLQESGKISTKQMLTIAKRIPIEKQEKFIKDAIEKYFPLSCVDNLLEFLEENFK